MEDFVYAPSKWVPFRDKEVLDRVRKIKRSEIAQHPNPDFHIIVIPDSEIEFLWLFDMFYRIKQSADEGRKCVLILPNPWPSYRRIAQMINKFRVDCHHLYLFAMDEYANEDGVIAPDTWRYGFGYAMKNYFYYQIDPDLRPAENQVTCFTNRNINDYGKMIADLGGADIVYTGPGWTGHLAFVEPDAPELQGLSLDEWMKTGPGIVTLSPFTLAQNSLHGSFGMSGDLAMVPPRAATIGPAEVVGAKNRIDWNAITVHGTATSWQRLITRLAAHGPVTPLVPTSIHQLLRTDFYITESNARDIEPDFEKGY
jgi:6-phosphogluconolactonase/glucosamine-6-phosphate isomerase/deaminase